MASPASELRVFNRDEHVQDTIHRWVRDHRVHHKHSDTDADPYTSQHGFFMAHIGWLMVKKHPMVTEKGRRIDVSDLENDPIVMFQKKYYLELNFVLSVILPMIVPIYFLQESCLDAFLVSSVLRIVILEHFLFLINSYTHMYGPRPYDKYIQPTESPVVAFFMNCEGYHNYHHTFPFDYRSAEPEAPFNLSSKIIETFAYFGLASDLKAATPEMIIARAERTGDGTPIRNKDWLLRQRAIGIKRDLSGSQGISVRS